MHFLSRLVLAAGVAVSSAAAMAGVQAPNVITQPANSIDFGTVTVGQSVTRTMTLTAPASNTAPITDLLPVFPPSFTLGGGTCVGVSQLNPGQSCTVDVTYTPSATGALSEAIFATCEAQTGMVVTGFVVTCNSQTASQLALFVANIVNSSVPVLSPLWLTLLALGLLGFGARGALRRVRR